jgi:hypothetical protein
VRDTRHNDSRYIGSSCASIASITSSSGMYDGIVGQKSIIPCLLSSYA